MSDKPLAPVIVVGGSKGGVGRTVTAVNLACMLALAGQRTLLVDFDPKGDATASLGLPRKDSGWPGLESLSDPQRFHNMVKPARRPHGLFVWPGGPAIEEVQKELWRLDPSPHDLLDQGLSYARTAYETILIDAPPGLDPLGCNALAAATVLLLPLTGGTYTEEALKETLDIAKHICNHYLRILGVRLQIRDDASDTPALPQTPGAEPLTMEAMISYDAATLRIATEQGLPVFEVAPESKVARSFVELAREVIARVIEAPAKTG